MERTVNTKFFTFSQNNSGGNFVRDEKKGIGEYVIVEAIDYNDANTRAEAIGLYFDGYGDCPCCGDRWSSQWSDDRGDEVPSIYGDPVEECKKSWSRDDAFIHYFDGTIERIDLKD